MLRIAMALACFSLCLSSGWVSAAKVAGMDDDEARRFQAAEQATWPADIVRLSNDYLSEFPRSVWSESARSWQRRAAEAMRVLSRRDVQLYRSAFQGGAEMVAVRGDLREAALGNQAAAIRLAHHYQKGHGGLPEDLNRYVGWLQFAAMLGSDVASYELALYYRSQDQPALAAQYEARAVKLGYNPPQALDHFRK